MPKSHELRPRRNAPVRSLQAIFGGADLTVEAMQLADEFTDQQSGRFNRLGAAADRWNPSEVRQIDAARFR